MLGLKLQHHRSDIDLPQPDRGVDAQHAGEYGLQLPQVALGFPHRVDDSLAALVVCGTRFSKRELARSAIEQTSLELPFERRELLAYCRLGHRQIASHRREAAGLDDTHEYFHRSQTIHVGSLLMPERHE